MNTDRVAEFPLSPHTIRCTAYRYGRILYQEKAIPWDTFVGLLRLDGAFFYEWWNEARDVGAFMDLCGAWHIEPAIRELLNDARFLFYFIPETVASFMIYCRDVTRRARLAGRRAPNARVMTVAPARLIARGKFDLLFDMPQYVQHVNKLVVQIKTEEVFISNALRDFLARHETIKAFHDLTSFLMLYCTTEMQDESASESDSDEDP